MNTPIVAQKHDIETFDNSAPPEIWKPIPGYEDYYHVSNKGRVMRVSPDGHGRNNGLILKNQKATGGYRFLFLKVNGREKSFMIHQLVMIAFVGGYPDVSGGSKRSEINHKNGNKTDNRLENLEYVTSSENHIHAARNGLFVAASKERHGKAKLTQVKVDEIRRLYQAGGTSYGKLARLYGVGRSTIENVVKGATWK